MDSLNESFVKGEMSSSQKQAVILITLIEKKDQDRCDLKNWTPISVLNIDAKIASKAIAERMKRLLPNLIHENQSGSDIPGRRINENIRSVLDILDYTKDKNLQGLSVFIDFEKAFDSLEWDFLIKDGAYYCYYAYVLRISRYSGFLWVVLTNTGIFLRSLKLCGKSRT